MGKEFAEQQVQTESNTLHQVDVELLEVLKVLKKIFGLN